jgi:hypothetical protein
VTAVRGTRFLSVTVKSFANEMVDFDASQLMTLDQEHKFFVTAGGWRSGAHQKRDMGLS